MRVYRFQVNKAKVVRGSLGIVLGGSRGGDDGITSSAVSFLALEALTTRGEAGGVLILELASLSLIMAVTMLLKRRKPSLSRASNLELLALWLAWQSIRILTRILG